MKETFQKNRKSTSIQFCEEKSQDAVVIHWHFGRLLLFMRVLMLELLLILLFLLFLISMMRNCSEFNRVQNRKMRKLLFQKWTANKWSVIPWIVDSMFNHQNKFIALLRKTRICPHYSKTLQEFGVEHQTVN